MNISYVDQLDLRFEPGAWAFAREHRAAIDAHFAAAQRAKPRLWNGRVLIMRDYEIVGGVLRGVFLETDYAAFHAWLRWDRPTTEAHDCFGAAAVLSSDGGFALARMAPHTANAGRVYFPCGTPDPSDIMGNVVDFDRSIARELLEETGLAATDFIAGPGWTIVEERARVVACKVLRARQPASALRALIEAHIAREPGSELAAVHVARGAGDLVPQMPGYVTAFLTDFWGRGDGATV